MKKFSSLFRAPALSCVSLLFTLHFSLFTFNSNAQGLTKHGEITSTGANYISKNGGIGGSMGIDKNGGQVTAASKIWMDRNLGATQVATSSTDAASYGDLYQWGRGTDGHQIRTSTAISTLSSNDAPGHASFIKASASPYDWRSGQNANLWQGVNGVNNPCPADYRIPTETELNVERLSWASNNAAGAFASPLKLPMAGLRLNQGTVISAGTAGEYWSSTVSGTNTYRLTFDSSSASISPYYRANGFSVRCIKDE